MKRYDTVKWGIIGCGDVTEHKSGPALQKAEGSQLVAVMRRNGRLAADYARRHGVPRWYDDAQKLIDDPEVNAVYIATPPAFHHPYALQVARAGKPAYIEKPMAVNYSQCLEIIDAFRKRNLPLFVAYYRRALPRFQKIKSWIDSGEIGNIRLVHGYYYRGPKPGDREGGTGWRLNPEIAGRGGYFMDLAPHAIDILQFLIGSITRVKGFACNQAGWYAVEDAVNAVFQFRNGAIGSFSWNYNTHDKGDRCEIIGDNGKIVFSIFGDRPVTLIRQGETLQFNAPNPVHIQQPYIQSVVAQLRGRGTCPCTPEEAASVNRIIDEIFS